MSQKHQGSLASQPNLELSESPPIPFGSLPKVVRTTLLFPSTLQEEHDFPWIGQTVQSPESDWPSIKQEGFVAPLVPEIIQEKSPKVEYQFYYGDLADQSKRPKDQIRQSSRVIKTKPTVVRVSIDGAWSGVS